MDKITGEQKVKLYIEQNLEHGEFWRNIKWFTNDMVRFCEENFGYSETADNYRRYLQTIRENIQAGLSGYNFIIDHATKEEVEQLKSAGKLGRSCLVMWFRRKEIFKETLFD